MTRTGTGMNRLSRKSVLVGLSAALLSMLLWASFCFLNPYTGQSEHDPVIRTGWTLLLPAVLAACSAWFAKPYPLLAAFLWSLPVSLYMACMPSIFALFGVTSAAYLISYLMMRSGW